MTVISLVKNLTDEPIALNLTGGPADDPIIKFASQIENKTLTEVEEIIKNLIDAREFNFFKLGGAIARAQALFNESKSEFRKYVEKVYGDYGKAMRAAQTYKKLVYLEIPWSAFEGIGWTKVLALLDVVTKDNVKQWVAKAKEMNFPSLKALVEAEKQKGKPGMEQGPKTVTTKTFQLHEDQKEVVND